MLILSGLNRIRTLTANDIGYGRLGTSSAAVNENNTQLGTAVVATELAIDKTTSTKTIRFDYVLPSTLGTSTSYTEFELLGNGTAVHYDRIVFTGITHTATDDLVISKSYYFEGA